MIMDDGDQGDPECSYLEDGVDTAQEAGDHRRQMMQFCGQHPACARSRIHHIYFTISTSLIIHNYFAISRSLFIPGHSVRLSSVNGL